MTTQNPQWRRFSANANVPQVPSATTDWRRLGNAQAPTGQTTPPGTTPADWRVFTGPTPVVPAPRYSAVWRRFSAAARVPRAFFTVTWMSLGGARVPTGVLTAAPAIWTPFSTAADVPVGSRTITWRAFSAPADVPQAFYSTTWTILGDAIVPGLGWLRVGTVNVTQQATGWLRAGTVTIASTQPEWIALDPPADVVKADWMEFSAAAIVPPAPRAAIWLPLGLAFAPGYTEIATWVELGIAELTADGGLRPPIPVVAPGAPGSIKRPTGPLRQPAPELPISVWLAEGTVWRNISAYIRMAQWRHGGIHPNRLGAVEQLANGALYLDDIDGYFNAFNPHVHIDAAPGALVEIHAGPDRGAGRTMLFKGFSRGVQNMDTPEVLGLTVMPLYSQLTWVSEQGEGLFLNVQGKQRVSALLGLLLDNLDVPARLRDIEASDMFVSSGRLNTSGLLSSGRRRNASVLGAFNVLAQIEGGRIYDNRKGEVVFTSYDGYGRGRARTERDIPNGEIERLFVMDPSTTIVNLIEGQPDSFTQSGVQELAQDARGRVIPFDLPVPETTIRNSAVVWFNLNQDPEWQFADWVRPVEGEHYELDADGQVSLDRVNTSDTHMTWYFHNPGPGAKVIRILKAEVAPYEVANSALLEPERNAASIDRYGPHAVQFPYELVHADSENEARGRVAQWAQEYSGMIGDEAFPWIACKIYLPDWGRADAPIWDIDDLATFSVTRLGTPFFAEKSFWVRGVEHTVEESGRWDIVLTLLEAHRRDSNVEDSGGSDWRAFRAAQVPRG